MKSYTKYGGSTTTHYLNGPPIPDGSRNITLTKIAGSLHDGTRSLEQLIEDLMAVNRARCKPLLPANEVAKIAKSIHKRPKCDRARVGRPRRSWLSSRVTGWVC
jgi:hypothetical protein